MAKKVLGHGNRFPARVRRLYFSEGEKRLAELRLLFAGYWIDSQKEKQKIIKKPRFHNT